MKRKRIGCEIKALATICVIIWCSLLLGCEPNTTPIKETIGVVSTVAGSGVVGKADGFGLDAQFNYPAGIAIDSHGNIFVADPSNDNIRKILPTGEVTTFAGSGTSGAVDGQGIAASFYRPWEIAIDSSDNIYVSDTMNHKIRKITPAGAVSTFAGSGTYSIYGPTDGIGIAATFGLPGSIAIDLEGCLYVTDSMFNDVRKIYPDCSVVTITNERYNSPTGIAVDINHNVYVSEEDGNEIWKIPPSGSSSVLAGASSYGYSDGTGSSASFNAPKGIAFDSEKNLVVVDCMNNRIRKVTLTGITTTIAGSDSFGSLDDDAEKASFFFPHGVAIAKNGDIYITDTQNHKIRRIVLTK